MSSDNSADDSSTDELEHMYNRPETDRNDHEQTVEELQEVMVALKKIGGRHHYNNPDIKLMAAYVRYTLGAMQQYAEELSLPKEERTRDTAKLAGDMYHFTDDAVCDDVMGGEFNNGPYDIDVDLDLSELIS